MTETEERAAECYAASGSRAVMADCFVPSELFASRTCSLITPRSSMARRRISASSSGESEPQQSSRIRLQIASIRASVEVGTSNFARSFLLNSIPRTPYNYVGWILYASGCRGAYHLRNLAVKGPDNWEFMHGSSIFFVQPFLACF
jgi:hypothetical protein